MTIYPRLILDSLKNVKYPGNGKSLVDNNMVEDDIRIDGNTVDFSIIFDKSTDPFIRSVLRAAQATLEHDIPGIDVKDRIHAKFRTPDVPKSDPLPGVRHIIAVASGKGGVGKSTVAANLAVALAEQGHKVGLLDADIFGPSVPKMFGVEDERLYMVSHDGRDYIEPLERFGVKLLSIGFVVDKDSAVIWRGGMASNAIRQLINDAWWGDLDYFVIDMPPGTSDIHLTLVQTLDLSGAIIVSTPQEVALADARKAISMFRNDQVNVRILGIVENMAWFTPAPHPDERYYLFGQGGARVLAETLDIPLLAEIPLIAEIGQNAERGLFPAYSESPVNTTIAQIYHDLAAEVCASF